MTAPKRLPRTIDPDRCWMPVKGDQLGKWSVTGQCKLRPVVMTDDGKAAFCKRHAPTNPTVTLVPYAKVK